MPTLSQFTAERWADAGKLPPKPAYVAYRHLLLKQEQARLIEGVQAHAVTMGASFPPQFIVQLSDAVHFLMQERLFRLLGEAVERMPGNHLPLLRTIHERIEEFRRGNETESVAVRKHMAHMKITRGMQFRHGRTQYAKADGSFAPFPEETFRYLDLDYSLALRQIVTEVVQHSPIRDLRTAQDRKSVYAIVGRALDTLTASDSPFLIDCRIGVTFSLGAFQRHCQRYQVTHKSIPQPQSLLEAMLFSEPRVLAEQLSQEIEQGVAPRIVATQPVCMNLTHELQDVFARLTHRAEAADPAEQERWVRQFVVLAVIDSLDGAEGESSLRRSIDERLDQVMGPDGVIGCRIPTKNNERTSSAQARPFLLAQALVANEREWFLSTIEAVVRKNYVFKVGY